MRNKEEEIRTKEEKGEKGGEKLLFKGRPNMMLL